MPGLELATLTRFHALKTPTKVSFAPVTSLSPGWEERHPTARIETLEVSSAEDLDQGAWSGRVLAQEPVHAETRRHLKDSFVQQTLRPGGLGPEGAEWSPDSACSQPPSGWSRPKHLCIPRIMVMRCWYFSNCKLPFMVCYSASLHLCSEDIGSVCSPRSAPEPASLLFRVLSWVALPALSLGWSRTT